MAEKVIVVGGGAAGLMAAGKAALRGQDVTVLERNDRPARKLMITGKGRCNVTNACTLINELTDQIPGNGRFLYGAFSRFMPYDTMDFFESLGVPLKIERGNRVFPESDKAVDIVDALVGWAKKSGAKLRTGLRAKTLLTENGAVTGVACDGGQTFPADAVVVATGGCSYPLTGSTGDGYALARSVGHTVIAPKPSLIPFETEESWCRRLQGLTLKNVSITLRDAESWKEVYTDFGEMLFTHFGVSGPIILSASSHVRDVTPGKYLLSIDLKPALSPEKLDERMVRDLTKYANRTMSNALSDLLPRSLIPVALDLAEISPELYANRLTREKRHELGELLKDLTCTIKGTRPIEEAIVTAGGVSTKEIDPKTMQSKLCQGLYFAGEVIDVDAYTGGFNLQIAFATGSLAGSSC